jgi:peptidyl-prolyl cis-trans isomerase SurA
MTAVACVAAALLAGPWSGARAQASATDSLKATPIVIDRVVATVEDRAVLQSEVEVMFKQYLLQNKQTELPPDQEKTLREEIVQALVADQLMLIQADKDGVKVEEKDVDAAVDRQIEQNKRDLGGDDAFEKQLAAEGLTLNQLRAIYRDKARSQLLIYMLDQKITQGLEATDRDVQAYYKDHAAELPKRPATVTLAHILIAPQPADSVRDAALAKITALANELKAGEDFATVATRSSDCPSAKYGGNLGLLKLEDLNNPPFAEAARKLAVGEVSPPVLTEFGYHLIKLEGVEGDQVRLRHILVKIEPTAEDLKRAAELAEIVREEVVGGADFAKEAAKYSTDFASKDRGGLVGEVPVETLPPEIKDLIKGLPAGGIAPVMKDTRGFRVLKIVAWTPERTYALDEARDELRRIVIQQKRQEKLASYVGDLKKKYSVEIKGE